MTGGLFIHSSLLLFSLLLKPIFLYKTSFYQNSVTYYNILQYAKHNLINTQYNVECLTGLRDQPQQKYSSTPINFWQWCSGKLISLLMELLISDKSYSLPLCVCVWWLLAILVTKNESSLKCLMI